ncbi:uncharacterized protein [Ptychodera flava]|uniref:uncharacterized protein n=1 Tax=Ptychodera flava TaxID=63121 RepID=UPI003969D254
MSSANSENVGLDEVDFARPGIDFNKFNEIQKPYCQTAKSFCRTDPLQPLTNYQQAKRKSLDSNISATEDNGFEKKKQKSDLTEKPKMNECKVDGSEHTVVITGPGCTINLNTASPTEQSLGVDSTDSGDICDADPASVSEPNQSSSPTLSQSNSSSNTLSKGPSMKKIFRFVAERIPHEWKNVARELPISDDNLIEAEIHQLEEKYRGNLKEQAYNSLIVWENSCVEDEECTKERLVEALKTCRLNYVVRELRKQRWMKT